MKTNEIFFTILVTLFSFNTFFGQNLIMKNDVVTQRFGKEIYYKDLNNNPLDGHYKIADERGNYSDLHFKKGKKDGKNTDYDYKGRILKTITYKNGKSEGTYTTYHQNGKISKQGKFVNGKEDGKWEDFNDKGEIKTIEHYKNGKKTGKWWKKSYYGQFQTYVYTTENYKDDEHFGHSEEKGEDNLLKWEREYINDQTYTHKGYYPNGKLYIIRHLKDGKVDGEKIKYKQDGVLLSKMIFKDDYKNGLWKKYDEKDAHLIYETSFIDNVKNGIAKEYNRANRISAEGMFKNGVKNDTWKHYNLAGKLIKEITYNLGKEISEKEYK